VTIFLVTRERMAMTAVRKPEAIDESNSDTSLDKPPEQKKNTERQANPTTRQHSRHARRRS
jgi:hypothetical protein